MLPPRYASHSGILEMMARKRREFRVLDAALSGDSAALASISRSAALTAEYATLVRIRSLVKEELATDARPNPFMAERVVQHLRSQAYRHQVYYGALLRAFRPVLVAALLLVASMAAYNIAHWSGNYSASRTAERMLGLPPVTPTAAFAADLPVVLPQEP